MIEKLEQIAADIEDRILQDIFIKPVLIDDCQIDALKYVNGNIMVGGYIGRPVEVPNNEYLEHTYAYYWLSFENIKEVNLINCHVIKSFIIERKKDCVLLRAPNSLEIIADKVKLDSITPTWRKDLNDELAN